MAILGRLFGTPPQSESNPGYAPKHARTDKTPEKHTVAGRLSRVRVQNIARDRDSR
jgi:hypothetical protein